MAINYTEAIESRRASTIVTGATGDYIIKYIVRNPVDQPVNRITGTIVAKPAEGAEEPIIDKSLGCGSIELDIKRTYFSIDKYDEVPLDDQAKLAAQFFADVKSILTV